VTAYDLHGLGLAVDDRTGDVAAALERRFRGFPRTDRADITLRYASALDGEPPDGRSRSVYEAGGTDVRHFPDADVLFADFEGVRLHADLGAGVTQIAAARFAGRARYIAAHPFTTLALVEMLRRRGRYNLHAGCLAREGRAVVIAGTAGAGKSTLALSLARAGLDYLGDDMLFLRHSDDTVRVLGFADAIGVTPQTAGWIPELAKLAERAPDEGFPKHLARVEDHFDVRVVSEAVPAVLVFPQIVPGRESRLEPLAHDAAWLRLVPDVLLTEPTATQAHLAAIAALTAQVECYTLHASSDLDASARLVAELL
jgi:hypothetical protein